MLDITRLNHSCSPNTEFYWNTVTKVEELRATRDIARGEELTDCYLDLVSQGRNTRDQRRELLQHGYGFRCTCQVCDLSDELSEEDDNLRKEASNHCSDCQDLNEIFDNEELLIKMSKAERWLELCVLLKYKVTHKIEAANAVFSMAMMVGQVEKAQQVAEQGLQLAIIRFGEENKNNVVEDWRRRNADPVLYMIG